MAAGNGDFDRMFEGIDVGLLRKHGIRFPEQVAAVWKTNLPVAILFRVDADWTARIIDELISTDSCPADPNEVANLALTQFRARLLHLRGDSSTGTTFGRSS